MTAETDPSEKGERNLQLLLASLSPVLLAGEYVFCTVDVEHAAAVMARAPLASFREAEGLSVVLRRDQADALKLRYGSLHRCITLRVHSSLEAVGLTAAVSGALARRGLSANVIAACRHDHVFVSASQAPHALQILHTLSEAARR